MNVDICYVISHGFAARMLLQTGLIQQLAQQGKTIAIISPDPEDENLAAFQQEENVFLFAGNDKTRIWDDDYLFKRKYYLEDIKSNPALWEKHIYEIFYSPSKHPWRRVRPFYYYLIFSLIKFFPVIRQKFVRNEHKYLQSADTSELIRQIKPKLVVATYPVNFLEAKVLYTAKQQNIATLIHLLSWDNLTAKGKFPMSADYFILWGEVMYRELKEHYQVSDENIYICGVPHFDNHIRIKKCPDYQPLLLAMGLRPDRPFLLFAMSAPRFAPKEIEIVEELARGIERNEFGFDLQLVVRPHPQNVQGFMADQSWVNRLNALQSTKVAVDFPKLVESQLRWSMQKQDMDQLSNLLAGCSICINSGSTVSVEALILDKPVILTSFDATANLRYWKSARRLVDYTHLKKFVGLGGAKVTRSFAEFKQAIVEYLVDPNLDSQLRRHALEQECYKNDGHSTPRVLTAVSEILHSLPHKS